ncbi:cytochrome P450 family 705 subfamily A polypeptide 27 [Euphorbia peplus]|nr:cytochrome P450 family 705 subfamily A polypeptide 27 [Euphorbia peplus]
MYTSDNTIFYFLLSLSFISIFFIRFLIKSYLNPSSETRLPPSPPSLPFIGHLHLVGAAFPTSFQTLARRYGPLMTLHIGSSTFIVASTKSVAKQIFNTHDLNFASRFETGPADYNIYKGKGFITSPYSEYWRFMRKLCVTELFGGGQFNRFKNIRENEITNLIKSLMKLAEKGLSCDLNVEFESFANNVICKMTMSKRFLNNDEEAKKMRKLVAQIMDRGAKLGVSEVFGILKKVDVFGHGKKLKDALLEYDEAIEKIIKDYEDDYYDNNGGDQDQDKDVMHILLETCRDPNAQVELTRPHIKYFILELFMASIDTESAAIQWTMAELINHPTVLNKLRLEINSVVNSDRLVNESDSPNLPYLRAVVKESLRLHPPVPLIHRECIKDCKINGYDVKSNSRLLVNAYAIMRDPDTWRDPDQYIPERFMEFDQNKGIHEFSYIPFGGGRRGCVGTTHAHALMYASVGALVQCFDWRVKDGDKIDISVANGFSGTMAPPLLCYPITHLNPF